MTKTPKYFMYFPGNYRWSAAFVNMLGRAAYGGADISELHKIGRALAGKAAEDDEAWFDACVSVADEVRGHAERFAASGHAASAAAFYLRACHYYQMGKRFRTPKDKTALDAYRTAVDCFHRFAALADVKIEIVEVPFEGKSLPGYFVHARNRRSARAPCVVFFDGLDVTKEPAALASISWNSAMTSTAGRSASSPSASAATTRPAVPRSNRALPPASPGARSGTITPCGSGASKRSSRHRCRCPATTSCGSWAPRRSRTH